MFPGKRLYENDDGNVSDLLCWPTRNQKPVPEALSSKRIRTKADSYEHLLDGLAKEGQAVGKGLRMEC